MKRVNVVVDERLVAHAKRLTGFKTTRQFVGHALRELVRHRKQRDILKLQGNVDGEGDLAAMRQGRNFR